MPCTLAFRKDIGVKWERIEIKGFSREGTELDRNKKKTGLMEANGMA